MAHRSFSYVNRLLKSVHFFYFCATLAVACQNFLSVHCEASSLGNNEPSNCFFFFSFSAFRTVFHPGIFSTLLVFLLHYCWASDKQRCEQTTSGWVTALFITVQECHSPFSQRQAIKQGPERTHDETACGSNGPLVLRAIIRSVVNSYPSDRTGYDATRCIIGWISRDATK